MGVTSQALHGAKVCLIPRPENNYQPLVLRRGPLAFASGLIVSAKVLAVGLVLLLPTTAELSTITNARILQLTNEERVANGLGALQNNEALAKAAAGKAKDIIDNDYFAHISPTGVTPWFWIQQEGYSYSVAGENLAIDFVQAEDAVAAWMASPGHRANILQEDYTETGLAVLTGEYQGGTSTIIVHMFGLPLGEVRPSQSSLSARPPAEAVPPTDEVASPIPSQIPVAPEVAKPPAVPGIKLLGSTSIVGDMVGLVVSGDVGSTVHITVNDKEVMSVAITEGGYMLNQVDLTAFEDGKLNVSAYAVGDGQVSSEKAKIIEIEKDTIGPQLNDDELSFLVSPATDHPHILMFVPQGDYRKLSVEQAGVRLASIVSPIPASVEFELGDEPIEINVSDELGNTGNVNQVDLVPAIFSDRNVDYIDESHRLNGAARGLVMVIGSILFVMLMLAILIKIKIQHPHMITHVSLVILLAVVLLFV